MAYKLKQKKKEKKFKNKILKRIKSLRKYIFWEEGVFPETEPIKKIKKRQQKVIEPYFLPLEKMR